MDKEMVLASLTLLAFTGYALAQGFGFPGSEAAGDAGREKAMQERWEKQLEELGLTEEDTIGEYWAARKNRMQQHPPCERMQTLREKLGLSGDATREEFFEALKAFCSDNPDECPRMGRGFRSGRRTCMGNLL